MTIDDVQSAYDQWAEQYDEQHNGTRDLASRVLDGLSERMRGLDVVEFGCGTGLNSQVIAQRARRLDAIDFSEKMLERARERVAAPHVTFTQHDVRLKWPWDDDVADVVVGNLVLEHVEELKVVFGEAARVLKSNGWLHICELHPYRQYEGKQARFEPRSDTADLGKEASSPVAIPFFVHHVSDFIDAANRSGFKVAHVSEWWDEGADRSTAPPRLLSLEFQVA